MWVGWGAVSWSLEQRQRFVVHKTHRRADSKLWRCANRSDWFQDVSLRQRETTLAWNYSCMKLAVWFPMWTKLCIQCVTVNVFHETSFLNVLTSFVLHIKGRMKKYVGVVGEWSWLYNEELSDWCCSTNNINIRMNDCSAGGGGVFGVLQLHGRFHILYRIWVEKSKLQITDGVIILKRALMKRGGGWDSFVSG
jgi:hypothetical protein